MLHLTTGAFDQMADWARDHLPEEACGLLAGRREGDEKHKVSRLIISHDA